MNQEPQGTGLPRFRLKSVREQALKTLKFLEANLVGKVVPSSDKQTLANQLFVCLNCVCAVDALAASIDDLADDTELSYKKARQVAWRLAANVESLKKGIPCPKNVVERPEHVCYGIIHAVNVTMVERNGRKQARLQIAVRLWSGQSAGCIAFGDYGANFHTLLNRNLANLPRNHPPVTPTMLQGYLVTVSVKGVNKQLEITHITATASQKAKNTAKARKRVVNVGKP